MDFWLRVSVHEFYIPLKLANYLSLIYFPYKKFPARQSMAAVTRVPPDKSAHDAEPPFHYKLLLWIQTKRHNVFPIIFWDQ